MNIYITRTNLAQEIKTGIIATVLIIIFGFNSYNCDMWAYENLYNRISLGEWPGGIEKGFIVFMRLASKMGLEYEQFLLLFSVLGMVVLIKGIAYFTNNVSSVLVCYFIFPFFLDVIQIRNYMAMAFSIYAIHFLVEKSKKGIIKFVICIVIAASFHNLSYIYLIFLILYVEERKVKKYIMPALWIGGVIFVITSNQMFSIIARFAPNIVRYIGTGLAGTAFATKIMYILYFIYVWIIFNEVKKGYKKHNWLLSREQALVFEVADMSNLFIFFMIYDVDFFRIYRNVLIIFYAIWCDYFIRNGKVKIKGMTVLISFLIISFIFFIGLHTFDTVVLEVLQNNRLF